MSVRVGRELSELEYIGRDDLRAVWVLRAQLKTRISTRKLFFTGRSMSGTEMPLGTAARTSDWDIMEQRVKRLEEGCGWGSRPKWVLYSARDGRTKHLSRRSDQGRASANGSQPLTKPTLVRLRASRFSSSFKPSSIPLRLPMNLAGNLAGI